MTIHFARRMALIPFIVAALNLSAHGADRFWTNPAGGLFGDAANWDDGMGDVPSELDTAIFDLAGAYTVEISVSRGTDRMVVGQGEVSLELAPGAVYTLLNPFVIAPGIVVGELPGDTADIAVRGGAVHATYTVLGGSPGALGSVLVEGAGARLDNDQQLLVGESGFGYLDLGDGAVATNGIGVLGRGAGAFGSATVTGDATRWEMTGTLTVGKFGAGDLAVSGGASLLCGAAIIAQNEGSAGSAAVIGAKTSWIIDGPLDVGMRSAGSLLITGGARVACSDFATIGTQPASPSGDPDVDGGIGIVTVLGSGSSFEVRGGFLDGDLYIGLLNVGTLVVGSGGTVSIDGCLTANDNSLLPDREPIVISLTGGGDYASAAAIAIGGEYLGGDGGPALEVKLTNGFVPSPGDSFVLMAANAGLDGFDLALPPAPAGLAWGLVNSDTRLELTAYTDACAAGAGDPDCNGNGILDQCDLDFGVDADCNGNGIPDACDIADETDLDCNANGVPDSCDIADGLSEDCNGNGSPDECDFGEVQQIIVPDPFGDGSFGEAAVIDGDRAVIGAPDYDSNGAVFIFRREGASWVQEAMLMETNPFFPPSFGNDVDLDGDLLAVGAPGESTVYVYRRNGAQWDLDQAIVDFSMIGFGSRVAASGDVVVGSGLSFGSDYGAAAFYRFEGGKWQYETTFTVVDAPFDNMQPATVDVDGNVAALGVHGAADGAVFMYRNDGSNWVEEAVLLPPLGLRFGHLIGGTPIALADDVLVVGSASDKSAFVYRHDGVSWNEEASFPLAGQDIDSFGKSVDVDGDLLAVRAQISTHFYRFDGADWRRAATLATPGASATRSQDLALDGSFVIAGWFTEDEAHAYDLDGPDCNGNGQVDDCDITGGTSLDINDNGVPDECECVGDVDGDGEIGFSDLLLVLFNWGPCPGCPADVNGNGEVEFQDVLLLLTLWGPCR